MREIRNFLIAEINERDQDFIEIVQFKSCLVKSKINFFPRLTSFLIFVCLFVILMTKHSFKDSKI